MITIAFAGRKQSGKTTCSEFVTKLFNETVELNSNTAKVYNFADPLKKDICINILGMSYEQCYGSDDQKNTITNIEWEGKKLTARDVMQFIGTNIFRKMKHNVWADATINKIKVEQPSLAIIADCRFPNEVEAVKNIGGYVIKLTRNPYNSDHASETALDPDRYDQFNFDLIIENDDMTIAEQNKVIYEFLHFKGILPL
jgi:hypothetical protein